MQGLLMRGAIVLQVMVLNGMLAVTGYNPDLTSLQQPAGLETGLRLLFSAVPAIASALGILALFAYPLHGQLLQRVRSSRTVPAPAAN
jgi:Na+/melibiose symporter-like transporter